MKEPSHILRPERRAMNIAWTAAGDYGFIPPFLAFFQDGSPDLYMNSIIGYVHKWYDPKIMNRLFDLTAQSFLRETLDGLLWVALESCAYQREVSQRPVLKEIRAEHARLFFLQEKTRSRQQWMALNSLVYALQAAKCRIVLGGDVGLANPWERRLFFDLQYDSDMSSQDIYERTLDIFHRYFHIQSDPGRIGLLTRFRGALHRRASRHLPSRTVRSEYLLTGRDFAVHGQLSPGMRGSGRRARFSPADLTYVEGCFGRSIYTEDESREIESRLCTLAHQNCHLHFTDGPASQTPTPDPLAQKVRRDAESQRRKNIAHYQSHQSFYQNSILHLCQQIRNALLVYPQPLPLPSGSGRLYAARIWRGLYLDDPRVFTAIWKETEADFSVDLLLDASASRLESQEVIASQGCIIAKSLQKCKIPVQVSSYLSIRGYTVINRLVSYDRTDDCTGIFRYFAAGWNRDGLAMRGAGQLMLSSPAKHKLLIVLTDASPNDDRPIPAFYGGSPIARDYSGKSGVTDTAREVRALRREGIHVCAILTGDDGDAQAAKEIFGSDFIRIEKMEGFSRAAGVLIQQQIEKLHFKP